VNSHLIEFGYELAAVIPYAYWLYSEGILKKTVSGHDTRWLYYFSPHHVEVPGKRHWNNMAEAHKDEIPNLNIHQKYMDKSRWLPPPYKEIWKNYLKEMPFEKPMVVVSNKRNIEWGSGIYNTLEGSVLREIFRIFSQKYKVIYNSTFDLGEKYDDTVPQLEYDITELKEQYGVVDISALCKQLDATYNQVQMMLYPHVDNFISLQGGSSILASYFAKKNIIYAVRGFEITCGSYHGWYKDLGGSEIVHVDSYEKLIEHCIMISS